MTCTRIMDEVRIVFDSMRSKTLTYMSVGIIVFVSCDSSGKSAQWAIEAKKPVEMLGKLHAKTGFGITCREYRNELGDTDYYIKEFLASPYSSEDSSFRESLLRTRQMLVDVTEIWDCDDPEWGYIDVLYSEHYDKRIRDALSRNGLLVSKAIGGVEFVREIPLPSIGRIYRRDQYDLKLAIQILWSRIGSELEIMRKHLHS